MDVLDWLPGSYLNKAVEGKGDVFNLAKHNLSILLVFPHYEELLVMLHLGGSSCGVKGDEEEVEEKKGGGGGRWRGPNHGKGGEGSKENVGVIGHTQQLEVPKFKKDLFVPTRQSKSVPDLMVDDTRDMYARDATMAFCEEGVGKKLYKEYSKNENISISSEDDDDHEMAKRLRCNPPSPLAFVGLIYVKQKILVMEEANEHRV